MNLPVTPHDSVQSILDSTWDKLKDFQRATVERIAAQLRQPGHSGRLLVADEVGLGKTIVAKGLIVSLLRDWQKPRPLRVTYICSNLSLAAENLVKLSVFPQGSRWVRQPSYYRLAEVARPQPVDAGAKLEICTLTPATSFSLTHGEGNREERAIIVAALLCHPQLCGWLHSLAGLFQRGVQCAEGWRDEVRAAQLRGLREDIVEDFLGKVECLGEAGGPSLLERICQAARQRAEQHRSEHLALLRKLREVFVKCCAGHLQADLFILDEFQRFESLLDQDEDNEQALIAQQVFRRRSAAQGAVLLLSATPYKAMSTVADDESDDNHLEKLKKVLAFLNRAPLLAYEPARRALQAELLRLNADSVLHGEVDDQARCAVEALLRPLICRTERGQIATHIDGLIDAAAPEPGPQLRSDDIHAYAELDQLVLALEDGGPKRLSGQIMSFFKSAAWPLSFSTGYTLQDELTRHYLRAPQRFKRMNQSRTLWLPRERINKFTLDIARDAPNPQVRWLASHVFGEARGGGPEMLLWLPPSWPHYPLGGYFAGQQGLSKTLLFSSWAMVPRMLGGLLSYEAERRVRQHLDDKPDYFARRGAAAQDADAEQRSQQRHTVLRLDRGDLATWTLIYPARCLVEIPLERGPATLAARIRLLTQHFKAALAKLGIRNRGSNHSHHWYLLAPMLLDREAGDWSGRWLKSMAENTGLAANVRQRATDIQRRLDNCGELGAMPADLPRYLATLALGSPAVCAYRALQPHHPEHGLADAATRVARGFVSLFNGVVGAAITRSLDPRHPWRGVVSYCAEGGVQAMLEEYLYLMAPGRAPKDMLELLVRGLGGGTSSVKVWKVDRPTDDTHLRCHYAVQLAGQNLSDVDGQKRVTSIRESFNSPFRPFVLASTSIGQEGLDFHWYCSEVVHWNLPNNPIDLEQREGRVNRYQSLVVRRRVVQAVGAQAAAQDWHGLFKAAQDPAWGTDLVPYWHYPQGDAKIRRLVPSLAFSEEARRYPQMQKILSLYRLAFGQPGQTELLEHLGSLGLGEKALEYLKRRLMIRLAPVSYHQPDGTTQGL